MATKTQETKEPIHYTSNEALRAEFSSRGLALLSPESLGIPASVHQEVYQQEMAAWKSNDAITPADIPAIQEVLKAPGLIKAIDQLLGEGWAVVPFTHNAPFCSGPRDQQWHKDDNGPYNSRKMRHHHSVQMEMIYYPQDVTPEMGPTACIPYAHYWTFDHEENHDNFAGADHLDFNYLLNGMEHIPVNGPDSPYSREDIINRNTKHDIRMREAVQKTGWPLVKAMEAAPVRAGSVLLYSHNTFHRGNHRRDHWDEWDHNPRFMWRFYLYRCTEPKAEQKINPDLPWKHAVHDALTETDLPIDDENLTSVWRHHYQWLHTGLAAPARPQTATWSDEQREEEAKRLSQQIRVKNDDGEYLRIGAAYQLASLGNSEIGIRHLKQALYAGRENIRRAATYGLAAMGQEARTCLIEAASETEKWVRKAGVFGLGEACQLDEEILALLEQRLLHDESVYVRSVAAGSLGCLGRRAIAHGTGRSLIPKLIQVLLRSLGQEHNRLDMSRAQERSIKFVRPTDECDVCEGNAPTFGIERFEHVRSNPRENVLWSLVMLCSHGSAVLGDSLEELIAALKDIVLHDKNAISYGFAQDALNRLAQRNGGEEHAAITALQKELPEILASLPMLCKESLVRCE